MHLRLHTQGHSRRPSHAPCNCHVSGPTGDHRHQLRLWAIRHKSADSPRRLVLPARPAAVLAARPDVGAGGRSRSRRGHRKSCPLWRIGGPRPRRRAPPIRRAGRAWWSGRRSASRRCREHAQVTTRPGRRSLATRGPADRSATAGRAGRVRRAGRPLPVGTIDVAVLRVDDDFVGQLVETIDQRADSGTVQ
jgi:hypothetical protein